MSKWLLSAVATFALVGFVTAEDKKDDKKADVVVKIVHVDSGKVLGVADDLVRALEHVPPDQQASAWVEGVAAIERKVAALLTAEGVTPIDAVGKPFDPRLHEAVTMEPTDAVPEGMVTRELQRGYELRDRVLRPALVVVSTGI
jgi:molecular chaperone GrpE (heat shock protein)